MSYNLKITAFNNRDYAQPFTLKDADGVAVNLTGCKLIFSIGVETTAKPFTSHATDGGAANKCIFVRNATAGEFELVLPYTVLKTIAPGNYVHDVILVDAAGKRSGVWIGALIVKKGVTV
jgi:hypothetical protein